MSSTSTLPFITTSMYGRHTPHKAHVPCADREIALGPHLFYNSPRESCVMIGRARKLKARKGKALFINAVNEVTRERAQSFLTEVHQQRIVKAYRDFAEESGFAYVGSLEEIRGREGSLSLLQCAISSFYAKRPNAMDSLAQDLTIAQENRLSSSQDLRVSLHALVSQECRWINNAH